MSLARLRLTAAALAVAAVTLVSAGCSTAPASPAPTSTGATETPATTPGSGDDVSAAWLDAGRMIGIVTWGSSSKDCQPTLTDATADGQTIHVTLADKAGENTACTADFAPRAIMFPVPEGIDVTQEVELEVAYGDLKADADLDALDSAPSGSEQGQPSAGWFDDDGILLLTYGSSTCPPLPEQTVQVKDQISVSFATVDRVCTMDLAPRLTVIELSQERGGDGPVTLRLQGDGLSGEVPVLG